MEFTTKKCSNQNLVCPGYSTTQKLRAPTLQGGSGKSVLKPAPELQALHGKATKIVFKYRSSAPRRSSIKQKKCFENKKNATGAGWCKKTAF